MVRTLHDIARDIRADWTPPHPTAVPYLAALDQLGSVDASYGFDTGRGVVRYFLSNAGTWRGPVARRIKDELRGMIK